MVASANPAINFFFMRVFLLLLWIWSCFDAGLNAEVSNILSDLAIALIVKTEA
jgi:hypothetical protein